MINVHLIASKSNVIEDIETLRKISDIIHAQGHEVLDEWVDSAYKDRVDKKAADSGIDWTTIFATNLENIAKADIVIAETSYNSFGVGYQVALAAQQKKPTLLLRSGNADTDAFATGVVDSWIQRETYTQDNLESVIKKFLQENDIATKDMRFNFFIDRPIYNYLRWAALKTGKTKAEVLRELVKREIEDKDY